MSLMWSGKKSNKREKKVVQGCGEEKMQQKKKKEEEEEVRGPKRKKKNRDRRGTVLDLNFRNGSDFEEARQGGTFIQPFQGSMASEINDRASSRHS